MAFFISRNKAIPTFHKSNFFADGRLYEDVFIPREFENTILKHVLLNNISFNGLRPTPLLFLQGKKGEGKSFMTETVLKGNNIFYKAISSSVLTGEHEGEAVDNLRRYYNVCEMDPANGKYSALVIDDFHLSIAVTKSTAGHTTNADNLIEALMSIADRKEKLKAPIILIGNDFTKAYAPLIRAGRSTISTWTPSLADKKEIVSRILQQHTGHSTGLSIEAIGRFVDVYKDQYIGFFQKVIDDVCFGKFETVTDAFATRNGRMSLKELGELINASIHSNILTIESLYAQADQLLAMKPEKLDE